MSVQGSGWVYWCFCDKIIPVRLIWELFNGLVPVVDAWCWKGACGFINSPFYCRSPTYPSCSSCVKVRSKLWRGTCSHCASQRNSNPETQTQTCLAAVCRGLLFSSHPHSNSVEQQQPEQRQQKDLEDKGEKSVKTQPFLVVIEIWAFFKIAGRSRPRIPSAHLAWTSEKWSVSGRVGVAQGEG